MTAALLALALDTTTTRLLVVAAAAASGFGGAFVGVVKLFPERTSIVVGYQVEVIETLRDENKRLAESVAYLENRLAELEGRSAPVG